MKAKTKQLQTAAAEPESVKVKCGLCGHRIPGKHRRKPLNGAYYLCDECARVPEAPQKPSATAEEIARDVLVRAIARKFRDRREQQARILAMRRILAELGFPHAEYYDGEDRRDGGRCPVCYRTGQRILDWGVCREHGVRWSLKTWHFQNCALVEPIQVPSHEVEKIESFHKIDPAHEPRPLGDHDHADPLVEEIEWELLEAVHANPPTDEIIAEEHKKLKWLAIRREEALKIDAATAEVFWSYGQTLDPYGIELDLPERYQQVGREYFARRPGGDIWVSFRDLPKATCEALWGPQFKRWEEECLRRDGELPVLRF